jgi:hypothetical protein
MSDVKPFKIHVEDSVLADLKTRLNMARFPNELELPKGEEWSYGTPQRVVMELTEFWRTQFDWRKVETELNSSLPQFITLVDAGEPHGVLDVHFVHKKSKNPHAIPLIFIHGWPGNFTEVRAPFIHNVILIIECELAPISGVQSHRVVDESYRSEAPIVSCCGSLVRVCVFCCATE